MIHKASGLCQPFQPCWPYFTHAGLCQNHPPTLVPTNSINLRTFGHAVLHAWGFLPSVAPPIWVNSYLLFPSQCLHLRIWPLEHILRKNPPWSLTLNKVSPSQKSYSWPFQFFFGILTTIVTFQLFLECLMPFYLLNISSMRAGLCLSCSLWCLQDMTPRMVHCRGWMNLSRTLLCLGLWFKHRWEWSRVGCSKRQNKEFLSLRPLLPSPVLFCVMIISCVYMYFPQIKVVTFWGLVLKFCCHTRCVSFPWMLYRHAHTFQPCLGGHTFLPFPTGLYSCDPSMCGGLNCLSYDSLRAGCSWPWLLFSRSFSSLQNANEIINGNNTLSIFQGCCEEKMSSFMSNTLKTTKLHESVGIK